MSVRPLLGTVTIRIAGTIIVAIGDTPSHRPKYAIVKVLA